MRLAKRPLRLPELWLETPVGDNSRTITSAKPHSRLPAAGKLRQSKSNSRRSSLRPSDRKAASPTGCRPSPMSRPWMDLASSTAVRSRRITPPRSATGSRESPRARGWCRLRLPARRLQPPSSRLLDQQSEPFKMSSLMSMPPTSSSRARLKTSAGGADSTKRSTQSPPATPSSCIGPKGLSTGAGPITHK